MSRAWISAATGEALPMVELQIVVYERDGVPSGGPPGRIFTRQLQMPHPPNVGERFPLLRGNALEGEDYEWADAAVLRRHWRFDGLLTLVFVPYHIDPAPIAESFVDGQYRAYWRSEDGDLYAELLHSGWEEYDHDAP